MGSQASRVLVTRPKEQSEKLAEKLANIGFDALTLPLVEILPIDITEELPDNRLAPTLIFVSANAVRCGVSQLRQQNIDLSQYALLAIGPATSAALAKEGLIADAPSSGFRSEEFLAYFDQQHSQRKEVTLVCGVGGRPYLQEELHSRGVSLSRIEVYRRAEPSGLNEDFQKIVNAAPGIVSIMNAEALATFSQLIDLSGNMAWKHYPLLVSSPRIQETAQQLGFLQIYCQSEPTESALIEFLTEFSQK